MIGRGLDLLRLMDQEDGLNGAAAASSDWSTNPQVIGSGAAFQSVRWERQSMERLDFDPLFRRFVGLGV